MQELDNSKSVAVRKTFGMLEIISLIVAFGVSKAVADTEAGMIIFICLILSCISYFFAQWYLKREKANRKFINFFIWASVLVWVIPLFGLLITPVAYVFARTKKERINEFKVIALGSFFLSIVNWTGATLLNEAKISVALFCYLIGGFFIASLTTWLIFSLRADRKKLNDRESLPKDNRKVKSFLGAHFSYLVIGVGSFIFFTQVFTSRHSIEWGKVIGLELIVVGILSIIYKIMRLSKKSSANISNAQSSSH